MVDLDSTRRLFRLPCRNSRLRTGHLDFHRWNPPPSAGFCISLSIGLATCILHRYECGNSCFRVRCTLRKAMMSGEALHLGVQYFWKIPTESATLAKRLVTTQLSSRLPDCQQPFPKTRFTHSPPNGEAHVQFQTTHALQAWRGDDPPDRLRRPLGTTKSCRRTDRFCRRRGSSACE